MALHVFTCALLIVALAQQLVIVKAKSCSVRRLNLEEMVGEWIELDRNQIPKELNTDAITVKLVGNNSIVLSAKGQDKLKIEYYQPNPQQSPGDFIGKVKDDKGQNEYESPMQVIAFLAKRYMSLYDEADEDLGVFKSVEAGRLVSQDIAALKKASECLKQNQS